MPCVVGKEDSIVLDSRESHSRTAMFIAKPMLAWRGSVREALQRVNDNLRIRHSLSVAFAECSDNPYNPSVVQPQ